MQNPARVGFAGLGLMGSRMARHFITKGFPLAVWNRTPERAQPLVALGAKPAKTPRELAEMSDVVVTCVADPNAVGRIVFPDDGSPGLARRIAEVMRSMGADMLEAPVTGSKIGAEKGTLLVMAGGSKELEQELMPVLSAFAAKVIHCGDDIGQASTVKLIGNTIISFMLEGFCEGVVLGRKAGVSLETILEVVMASGFASPYYNFKGAAIAKRDFETHFSVDLLVKDQNLMLEEAHAHKVPMPGLASIREVFQAARAQGWGEEDIAAVVKALEKAAGL